MVREQREVFSGPWYLDVGVAQPKAAAQVIAGIEASWATFDPLWGDVPFARLDKLGSGAFAKGAEPPYVTLTVAHARDTRTRGFHH